MNGLCLVMSFVLLHFTQKDFDQSVKFGFCSFKWLYLSVNIKGLYILTNIISSSWSNILYL